MAAVRPFRGLRFREAAGELSMLLAPPAESTSSSERAALAEGSAFNSVWVSQPEGSSEDRSKYIRYARSAARIAEWRRSGALAPDSRATIYAFFWSEAPVLVLLARIDQLRPLASSDLRGRDEHLRLFEATQTHFDLLTAVTDDQETSRKLREIAEGAESGVLTEEAVATVVELLQDADLFLVNGANALEAAKSYREGLGRAGEVLPADWIPVALCLNPSEQLNLLPLEGTGKGMTFEALSAALSESFATENLDASALEAALGSSSKIGIQSGSRAIVVDLSNPRGEAEDWLKGNSTAIAAAPLSVFANSVIRKLPGIDKAATISYTRGRNEAATSRDFGDAIRFRAPQTQLLDVLRAAKTDDANLPWVGPLANPFPTGHVFWSLRESD